MLFSSLEFLFLFLPASLIAYYALLYVGAQRAVIAYLVITSLIFYGFWNPSHVLLLTATVIANYGLGVLIAKDRATNRSTVRYLAIGVILNLCTLGYYKYFIFFASTLQSITGGEFQLSKIVLPLAISFYTFQQIAYLIDVSRGHIRPEGLVKYAVFVIFFPQLIAGPIVHYREVVPQFFDKGFGRFWTSNLIVGTCFFTIGLFKKTVIADTAAMFSSPVFADAQNGQTISFILAWQAAMCYTIQLYFDFSGYSDMAIGLARMFGIKLPVNFHSPLKASSIIEYWRRWHITLQQFIVAYMYQPSVLPLARFAAAYGLKKWGTFWLTVVFPTLTIFVVIGLWHGAGWTFILFGTMHGIYLSVNEFWRAWNHRKGRSKSEPKALLRFGYHALTLTSVVFSNIAFRAESVSSAAAIWKGMIKPPFSYEILNSLPSSVAQLFVSPFLFALACSIIIFCMPNSQQIMGRYSPTIDWDKWRSVAPPLLPLQFRLSVGWAVIMGVLLFLGAACISRGQSEFIYFNF